MAGGLIGSEVGSGGRLIVFLAFLTQAHQAGEDAMQVAKDLVLESSCASSDPVW